MKLITASFLLALCLSVNAFHSVLFERAHAVRPARPSSQLLAGGFGGSAGSSGKKVAPSSKQIKLKPKQQWDRYSDLKQETKVPVGIRIKEEEDSKEWLGVGYVRSKDSAYTAISVAMQRALIAEVRVDDDFLFTFYFVLGGKLTPWGLPNYCSMRNGCILCKFLPKRLWSGAFWTKPAANGQL